MKRTNFFFGDAADYEVMGVVTVELPGTGRIIRVDLKDWVRLDTLANRVADHVLHSCLTRWSRFTFEAEGFQEVRK